MRLIKIFVSVFVLLVVVGIVALTALVMLVDPNKLKPVIAKQVMINTGYVMSIEGNLSWSFYPRLGVNADHILLKMPDSAKPFADLHNILIVIDIADWLHGKKKPEGDIYIADAILLDAHLDHAHLSMHWLKGVATLDPVTASLYHGSLIGKAQGSDFSNVPKWNFEMELKDVSMKPLLQDVNGANSKIKFSGVGQVKLQAKLEGKNRQQLVSHLNGNLTFAMNNGVIEGTDINYLVQTADALLNKGDLAQLSDTNQTPFNKMDGLIVMNNGMGHLANLDLISSTFSTTGTGDINLMDRSMNVSLQVATQQNVKTQWMIPLSVTGDLSKPDVRLDTLKIKEYLAKQGIEKAKTKIKEEIDKHPGKVGDFIKGLLGN